MRRRRFSPSAETEVRSMASRHRRLCCLGMTLGLCLSVASSLLAQAPAAATPKGTVDRIKVHGKSLEGNLEGDSPDRDVFVYLPASYASVSYTHLRAHETPEHLV